ncbi:hypothetical protein CO657_32535 (plasmid) [Rhizobium acidisoli]|uniref:Zinc finger CGNR domain-containing protein n=1 Tax=Rhizobium acidisoli TaxID=1538158 RepID=A0AAE5WU52_9HYPH|nr:ABATE domain-containing protein [Rhizobium acidisoli]KPH04289.1 hypothetical protein AOG23_34035 [Rhizobium acidisoli]QAS82556.1 hypothetical protein CO657_32535 [Rhizobium acidisoli]
MATSTSEMRLSGGHPALDFVNTVDSRRGRWGPDLLQSLEDLVALAERLDLLDHSAASRLRSQAASMPEEADLALTGAKRLREAVYRLFVLEDVGEPYPPEDLGLVEAIAQLGRTHQVLEAADIGFKWALPVDDLHQLGQLFAIKATDLLIERGQRRAVRECKGDNCGWLFIDHSRNGRRMWCSEATCGSHSRVKRFRMRSKPR